MHAVIKSSPASILHKSIAGRFRPVMVADWPIMARYRFMKNTSLGAHVRRSFFHVVAFFVLILEFLQNGIMLCGYFGSLRDVLV